MIIRTDNKNENFYSLMGPFFGSRIVQQKTNDRIFDDSNKEWIIYMNDERVVAFVSISHNIIKNVYTIKDSYLLELLIYIYDHYTISPSTVSIIYENLYSEAGFIVEKIDGYKKFISIRSDKNGKTGDYVSSTKCKNG